MNRQFIAVVPYGLSQNPELKQLMGKLKRTTKEREKTVRWVAPELWHVTLRFLGDLGEDSARLREFFNTLSLNSNGLQLRLQGLGAFPTAEDARVLWIGVQENQAFLELQAQLSSLLNASGFPPAEREFNPHLTLGRFRNPLNATDLVQLGGRKHFGDYPVRELVLFESVLQGNIVKYTAIARKPLN